MSQYQDNFDLTRRTRQHLGQTNLPLRFERDDSCQPSQMQRSEANMPIFPENEASSFSNLSSFKSVSNKPRNFAPELYVQALAAKSNLGLFDTTTNTAALDALRAYGSSLQSPHGSPKRKQNSIQNFQTQLTKDYHHGSLPSKLSFNIESRNTYNQSDTEVSGGKNYNQNTVSSYDSISHYQGKVPHHFAVEQNRVKLGNDWDSSRTEFDEDTIFSQGNSQQQRYNTPDSNTSSFTAFKPIVSLNTVEDEDEFLYGDSNPSDTPISTAPLDKAGPQTIDIGGWSDDEITVVDEQIPGKPKSNRKDSVPWEQNTLSKETSLKTKEVRSSYEPRLEFSTSVQRDENNPHKTIDPKCVVSTNIKNIPSSNNALSKIGITTSKKKFLSKKNSAETSKYAAAADLLRKKLNLDKPSPIERVSGHSPRDADHESSLQFPINSGKRMKLATYDKPTASEALKLPNFVINVEQGSSNTLKRVVHTTESSVDLRNPAKPYPVTAAQDVGHSRSPQFETQRVVRDKTKELSEEPIKALPKHYMEPDISKGKSHGSPDRHRSYSRSPRRRSPRRRSPSPDYRYRSYGSRNRSRSRPRPRYGRSRERSPRGYYGFHFRGRGRRMSGERRYKYSQSPPFDSDRSKRRSTSSGSLSDSRISKISTVKPVSKSPEKTTPIRKPVSFSIGSSKPDDESLIKNPTLNAVGMPDLKTTSPGQVSPKESTDISEDMERIVVDLLSLCKVISQSDHLSGILKNPIEEPIEPKTSEQPLLKPLNDRPTQSATQVILPDLSIPPPVMHQQAASPYLSPPLMPYSLPYPYNMQSYGPNLPPNMNYNPAYPPPISPIGGNPYQQSPLTYSLPPLVIPEVTTKKPQPKRTCSLKTVPLLTPLAAFAEEEDQSETQKEPSKIKNTCSDPRWAIEEHLKKISEKTPQILAHDEKALTVRFQKLLEERDLIQKKLRNTSDHTVELRTLKQKLEKDAKNMRTSADKKILQQCQTVFDKASDDLNRFIREAKDLNQEMQEIQTKIKPQVLEKIEKNYQAAEQKPSHSQIYSCYDTGNHWCEICSLQFSTIPKMIEHLHKKGHIENVDPFKSVAGKEPAKETPGKNTILQPAKGVEFITPLFAYYCSLCKESLLNQSFAEQHVKGHTHTVNYANFLKENPIYIQKRDIFKDAAIVNAVKEKRKKELADLYLAKRLIKEKQQQNAERLQSKEETLKRVQDMLQEQKQKEEPVQELDEMHVNDNSPSKVQVGVGIKLTLSAEKENTKAKEEKSLSKLTDESNEKCKSDEAKTSRFKPNPSIIYIGKAPNYKPRLKSGDKTTAKPKTDELEDPKKSSNMSEKKARLDEKIKETLEKMQSSESFTKPSTKTVTPLPEKAKTNTNTSEQENPNARRPQKPVVGCQSQAEAQLDLKPDIIEVEIADHKNKESLKNQSKVKQPAKAPSSVSLSEIKLPASKPPPVEVIPASQKTKTRSTKPLTEEEKDFLLLGINKSDMLPIAVPRPPPKPLEVFPKLPPFPPPLIVPPPNIVLQQSPEQQSPYKPYPVDLAMAYRTPPPFNLSMTAYPPPSLQQLPPDKNLEIIDMEIDEVQVEAKITLHKPLSPSIKKPQPPTIPLSPSKTPKAVSTAQVDQPITSLVSSDKPFEETASSNQPGATNILITAKSDQRATSPASLNNKSAVSTTVNPNQSEKSLVSSCDKLASMTTIEANKGIPSLANPITKPQNLTSDIPNMENDLTVAINPPGLTESVEDKVSTKETEINFPGYIPGKKVDAIESNVASASFKENAIVKANQLSVKDNTVHLGDVKDTSATPTELEPKAVVLESTSKTDIAIFPTLLDTKVSTISNSSEQLTKSGTEDKINLLIDTESLSELKQNLLTLKEPVFVDCPEQLSKVLSDSVDILQDKKLTLKSADCDNKEHVLEVDGFIKEKRSLETNPSVINDAIKPISKTVENLTENNREISEVRISTNIQEKANSSTELDIEIERTKILIVENTTKNITDPVISLHLATNKPEESVDSTILLETSLCHDTETMAKTQNLNLSKESDEKKSSGVAAEKKETDSFPIVDIKPKSSFNISTKEQESSLIILKGTTKVPDSVLKELQSPSANESEVELVPRTISPKDHINVEEGKISIEVSNSNDKNIEPGLTLEITNMPTSISDLSVWNPFSEDLKTLKTSTPVLSPSNNTTDCDKQQTSLQTVFFEETVASPRLVEQDSFVDARNAQSSDNELIASTEEMDSNHCILEICQQENKKTHKHQIIEAQKVSISPIIPSISDSETVSMVLNDSFDLSAETLKELKSFEETDAGMEITSEEKSVSSERTCSFQVPSRGEQDIVRFFPETAETLSPKDSELFESVSFKLDLLKESEDQEEELAMDSSESRSVSLFPGEAISCVNKKFSSNVYLDDIDGAVLDDDQVEKNKKKPSIEMEKTSSTAKRTQKTEDDVIQSNSKVCHLEEMTKNKSEDTNVENQKATEVPADLLWGNVSNEDQAQSLIEKFEQNENVQKSGSEFSDQKSPDLEESSNISDAMKDDNLYLDPKKETPENTEKNLDPETLNANPAESSCDSNNTVSTSAFPSLKKFDTEDILSNNSSDGPPFLSEFSLRKAEHTENSSAVEHTRTTEEQTVVPKTESQDSESEGEEDSNTDEYEAETE